MKEETEKEQPKLYHSTEREIEFINNIGIYTEEGGKTSKVDLLRGYLEGVRMRKIWTGMDKKRIVLRATRELEKHVNLSLSII